MENKKNSRYSRCFRLWSMLCVAGITGSSLLGSEVNEIYIQERVKEEVKAQVAQRNIIKQENDLDKKVEDRVLKVLEKQNIVSPKKTARGARCSMPTSHKKRTVKPFSDRYILPNWPLESLFYEKNDFIQFTVNYDTATQGYSSRGHTQDLSKNVFGEHVTLKDTLLVSKLASEGKLTSAQAGLNSAASVQKFHYLSILADQNIEFDASQQTFGGAFHYARSYCKGNVSVGFNIPIVGKTNKLDVKDMSDANRTKLTNVQDGKNPDGTAISGGPTIAQIQAADKFLFFKQYPEGFESFIDAILAAKNMHIHHKDTQIGFGDVSGYVNVEMPSSYFDRFVTGFSLQLPTARERDFGNLWDQELGNGGFVEASTFGSVLWQRSDWLNPHVNAKVTYAFAAKVNRRVPTTESKEATLRNLVLGQESGLLPSVDFSELDSSARGFADQVRKIKIRPGPELFARIGNVFENFIFSRGCLDIFYDLKIKGRDYLARRRNDDPDNGSVLNLNSWSVAHNGGARFSYQFNEQYRCGFGGSYIFAGRNTPKTLALDATLNIEF
jgi:hypothetical protein